MSEYLPIGSVVRLFGGTKKLMIYGRKQIQSGVNRKWDYVGCLYPEGNLSEKYNVFLIIMKLRKYILKGMRMRKKFTRGNY
ncbi:DUF4176 domain-containing protein [Caloramator sp. mosi_1]|jgi:hypothetical protein|nr:DUF4176 domain-containing protein [Caloramator sp. mosi_1]WDC83331.1 DUF4176 domain-containing protein [Caloramator sp. mosi_1]